jgi:hypothetical protein
MKAINLLICKLYENFVYKNVRSSVSQYILAKISVSLIILFWLYVFFSILEMKVHFINIYMFDWVYLLLFGLIFYFLGKNAWTLIEVEQFIDNEDNKGVLNNYNWILWISVLTPLLLVFIFR